MPIDFGDEAQEMQETFLRKSLDAFNKSKTSIPYSGVCLHCSEPVHQKRFCDSLCREHWEASNKKYR
jgi:hypothetical protein